MECLNLATALSALIAALLWGRSATVKVKHKEVEEDSNGLLAPSITVNGIDPFETQKKQSYWSSLAAIFAGISALCQFFTALLEI